MSTAAERRTASEAERPAPDRRWLVLEIVAVLGVSFGASGLYALLKYIDNALQKGGLRAATATVVGSYTPDHPWLDLAYQLAGVVTGLMPPLLAIVLLARSPGGRGLGIGLQRGRTRVDLAAGAGLAALIGLPGLALVWGAHALGANVGHIAVVDIPDVWYRLPVLVLSALQNGIAEEVVVVGYLLVRLRQLGWSDSRALGASAILRGSYHLYQGWGAFFGNLVMGLIFGWWFQRTRRVVPLIIAHSLIDAVSFIGYVYLHDRVSWI